MGVHEEEEVRKQPETEEGSGQWEALQWWDHRVRHIRWVGQGRALPGSSRIQLMVASLTERDFTGGGSCGAKAELSLGRKNFEKPGENLDTDIQEEINIGDRGVTKGQGLSFRLDEMWQGCRGLRTSRKIINWGGQERPLYSFHSLLVPNAAGLREAINKIILI